MYSLNLLCCYKKKPKIKTFLNQNYFNVVGVGMFSQKSNLKKLHNFNSRTDKKNHHSKTKSIITNQINIKRQNIPVKSAPPNQKNTLQYMSNFKIIQIITIFIFNHGEVFYHSYAKPKPNKINKLF